MGRRRNKKKKHRHNHDQPANDPHEEIPVASRPEIDALRAQIDQVQADQKQDRSDRNRNFWLGVAATIIAAVTIGVTAGQGLLNWKQLNDFERSQGAELTLSFEWNPDRTQLRFLAPNLGTLAAPHVLLTGQIHVFRVRNGDPNQIIGKPIQNMPFKIGGDETVIPPDPKHVLWTMVTSDIPAAEWQEIDNRQAVFALGATLQFENGFGKTERRGYCWQYIGGIWNRCNVFGK